MIEATVQGRFPFLGKDRVPGDIITAEELAGVSQQVIDALAGQKLLVLSGDTSAPGPHDPEAVAALQASVDRLRDTIATMAKDHADAIAALREALPGAVKVVVQQEIALAAGATAEAILAAPAAPRQPQRRV